MVCPAKPLYVKSAPSNVKARGLKLGTFVSAEWVAFQSKNNMKQGALKRLRNSSDFEFAIW
jgi:hypothetical protein